jgi:hypothetical protein
VAALAKLRQDLKEALKVAPKGSDLERGLKRAIGAIERAESAPLDKRKQPC